MFWFLTERAWDEQTIISSKGVEAKERDSVIDKLEDRVLSLEQRPKEIKKQSDIS